MCESNGNLTANVNSGPFDNGVIQQFWYPIAYTQAHPPPIVYKPNKIHSTHKWNSNHLFFFHLHFFNSGQDWQTYLCPVAPLTPDATKLNVYCLTPQDFADGSHYDSSRANDEYFLKDFGDIIGEIFSRVGGEPTVDRLAHTLLKICNPELKGIQSINQVTANFVPVGAATFKSTPDQLLVKRVRVFEQVPRYIFLVVKDKVDPVDLQGQLGGEILAAGVLNYQKTGVAQTVFAMTLKGVRASLYRVDFPLAYLKSIVEQGKPQGHVVIFKYTGGEQHGLDVSAFGPQRTKLLEALCSVISFCKDNIYPHVTAQPSTEAPCTGQRLALLQTITNKQ